MLLMLIICNTIIMRKGYSTYTCTAGWWVAQLMRGDEMNQPHLSLLFIKDNTLN